MLGVLIDEAEPLRLPDIGADPRSVGFPPNHPPMTSFLGAPVDGPWHRVRQPLPHREAGAPAFTEDDEAALVVLATQAGDRDRERAPLRGDAARRSASWRDSNVLEERERIAKELHDGVIQSLFAVGMGLQGAAAVSDDAEVDSAASRTPSRRSTARSATSATTSSGCDPGILADRQLGQALDQLGAEFQGEHGRASRRRRRCGRRRGARSEGGGHRPVHARGAVERRSARGCHDLPRLARSVKDGRACSRSTTTAPASTSRSPDGHGVVEPARAASRSWVGR